jgi:WD40 repeat protein
MKIETPQILWNTEVGTACGKTDGKAAFAAAALLSVSMIQSGIVVVNSSTMMSSSSAAAAASSAVASSVDSSSTTTLSPKEASKQTVVSITASNNNNNNTTTATENGRGVQYTHVLATAGNSNQVNLWRLLFPIHPYQHQDSETIMPLVHSQQPQVPKSMNGSNSSNQSSNNNHVKDATTNTTKIDFLVTLSRHELPVNVVKFSPNGLHLATAGDSGSIIIYSVPSIMCGNNNGQHYWSQVSQEKDLIVRVVNGVGGSNGITDLSWSSDSKRILVASIDHSICVCEQQRHHQQQQQQQPLAHANATTTLSSIDMNGQLPPKPATTPTSSIPTDAPWRMIYRSTNEHKNYVQGVAYDPLGVYLASMSNDRTVQINTRKIPSKYKKKVLRPSVSSSSTTTTAATASDSLSVIDSGSTSDHQYHHHQKWIQHILSETKFEIANGGKAKRTLKWRPLPYQEKNKFHHHKNDVPHATIPTEMDIGSSDTAAAESSLVMATPTTIMPTINNINNKKQYLFTDESTLSSFFRRLAWTCDGAYLITPAAVYHRDMSEAMVSSKNEVITEATRSSNTAGSSFCTYLFARHQFEDCYTVLPGLDKVK